MQNVYHQSTSIPVSLIETPFKKPIGNDRNNQRTHHKSLTLPSQTYQSLQTGGQTQMLELPLKTQTIVKLINTTDIGYNILLEKLPSFNAEKA